jgi:hypothetical protein
MVQDQIANATAMRQRARSAVRHLLLPFSPTSALRIFSHRARRRSRGAAILESGAPDGMSSNDDITLAIPRLCATRRRATIARRGPIGEQE